jgi:hypothetical protein
MIDMLYFEQVFFTAISEILSFSKMALTNIILNIV